MSDEDGNERSSPKDRAGDSRAQNPLGQLKSLLLKRRLRPPLKLTEDHIHSIVAGRRAIADALGPDLFSDPALDIVLELYAAMLAGRRVLLSELAITIQTPESTTTRWIAALEERGVVTTERDEGAPNRVWLTLSLDAAVTLKRLTDQWGSAFVSI